jgi:hypothetical protein
VPKERTCRQTAQTVEILFNAAIKASDCPAAFAPTLRHLPEHSETSR